MSLLKRAQEYKVKIAIKEKKTDTTHDLIHSLGGSYMVSKSYDPLTGQVSIHHGTNKKNIPSILEKGLLTSKGGISEGALNSIKGTALGDAMASLMSPTEGKVYTTRSPFIAGYMSSFSNPNSKMSEALKSSTKGMGPGILGMSTNNFTPEQNKLIRDNVISILLGKQPYVSGKIPYSSYVNDFTTDKDLSPLKYFAQKTMKDIDPKYLKGNTNYFKNQLQNIKNIPSYIKSNPGRFALGAGLLGVGGNYTYQGLHNLYNKLKGE